MKRLRVATLFTEFAFGGDENRVLSFAQTVDRDRFDHLVVTLRVADAEMRRRCGPMEARYQDAGIRYESLGLPRRPDTPHWPRPLVAMRDTARLAEAARRLATWLRQRQIDVLDARMNYNMVVGLVAARLARVPVAIATEYYVPWWSRAPWRFVAPAVFDGFDAVVSDSRWALDQYRRDLGRPLPHGVVIQNGIPQPRPTRSRADVRRALGIPLSAPLIAQVARVNDFKGQLQLVRAAGRVLRDAPDAWLLVCGYAHPPDYTTLLAREAAALGIGDRVRIAPWPGPVADVWGAVDFHAHPSLLDSSPIAIHESMATGLPAVVSSAGGIPELVAHEQTGLVVPPDDVDALARALTRLVREPATAQRLAAAARQRYLDRHRPEHMTRAIEALMVDLYQRATQGPVPLEAVG